MKIFRTKSLGYLYILLLTLAVSACANIQAPIRNLPTQSQIDLEIVDAPTNIGGDKTVSFEILTQPNSECNASIAYPVSDDEHKQYDFPTLSADGEGYCQWNWKVPPDINSGEAEFRASTRLNNEYRISAPLIITVKAD